MFQPFEYIILGCSLPTCYFERFAVPSSLGMPHAILRAVLLSQYQRMS